MRKSFKYKAVCNKQTHVNAMKWLTLCCHLYNCALEHRRMMFRDHAHVSVFDQMNELPEIKKAFSEFKQIDAQALQDVVQRLDKAFKAFFRRIKKHNGKAGYPRFKNAQSYNSFTLKQTSWQIDGKYLYIRNVGILKLRLHRPIEGKIKTITVRLSTTGEWFVCFSCDEVPEKLLPKTGKAVGIDLGLNFFAVDSDGEKWNNPRHLRNKERYLKRVQRSLYRKQKGGKNRAKAKIKLAKAHQKVANQRKDFAHKFANYYVERYDHIVFENLSIRGMVRNKYLAKSISDAAWNIAITVTTYKAANAGRLVEQVSAKGTTIECNVCGQMVPKKLHERLHVCPACGVIEDRDENAAKNIRDRASSFGLNAPAVMGHVQEAQIF